VGLAARGFSTPNRGSFSQAANTNIQTKQECDRRKKVAKKLPDSSLSKLGDVGYRNDSTKQLAESDALTGVRGYVHQWREQKGKLKWK